MKQIKHITQNDGTYYPLFNLKGLRSSITPFFGGDLKLDHHHFALKPTTQVDLFNDLFSRHVIIACDNEVYFLNGQTEKQQQDEVIYETGLLSQRVIRKNHLFEIDTKSYIPLHDNVELHLLNITNTSDKPLKFNITTAIPLYGRSADNLRDHRHVTSLLNRIQVAQNGILLYPTLSFDERGHQANHTVYSVFAYSPQANIKNYIPVLDDFMNGGSIQFPKGLDYSAEVGSVINGYEAIGGMGFEEITLNPQHKLELIISIGIHESIEEAIKESTSYFDIEAFEEGLSAVERYFESYTSQLQFNFYDEKTSHQLNFMTIQPMLRRYFGNSYLPHHDYGKGGRGWRDLWQDLLALIMMNDASVYELLLNNFQGVRLDGSNATIIGDKPGEFKADRNQITRVWSDHGAWPLLTTEMYIHETGEIDFLLKKQTYFKDQFTHYTHKIRKHHGPYVETAYGKPYEGTILEHLLLQNLVGHHHIGEKGFVKLEDADWNDGLDMATKKGETIAFTHMYASNLKKIAELIKKLPKQKIVLFKELELLLDTKPDLNRFFDEVVLFSGDQFEIDAFDLADILNDLYQLRIRHLHQHAFEFNMFQSYINNDGTFVDDEKHINLTGQTFALLCETATKEQAKRIAEKTRALLFDPSRGGYHLNTDYQKVMFNMGRAYGFAYNHKENGAVFSHMAVMYAYGLYQYQMIDEAHEAIMSLLLQAQKDEAKVVNGIPEYFNDRGIGMYPYLTGSASWMLKLLRTEVFGIKLNYGKLYLEPKLKADDFIDGKASIYTVIHRNVRKITYHNPKHLNPSQYRIHSIVINNQLVTCPIEQVDHDIEVYLDEKL
ncbi:MAG: cellobiose phosphorylase [Bacillota bacterium]|nr:MAG: cellobiose phosphorylase [Bacillota bacterium]